MKKECTITILGTTWKVQRTKVVDNDLDAGGCANFSDKIISIREDYNEEIFLQTFFHEGFEIISGAIGCTYTRLFPEKADYFILSHKEMNTLTEVLYGICEDVKRKIGIKNSPK